MFAAEEILDMAILIEKNGEAAYRNAIQYISNQALISLLEWMADEEVKHAKWFLELKEEAAAATPAKSPFVQNMGREFISGILGEQSFSLKEVDFSQIDSNNDLIDIFIEFEEDGILFYEMLQPFIQDQETLEKLGRIIAEEKRHIEQLTKFKESETP